MTAAASRSWEHACAPVKDRRKRRNSRPAAAVEGVRADLISALAAQGVKPGLATLAESLGQAIADGVLPQLDARAGDSRKLRAALADHFWCDLLAQIACVMNRLSDSFDKIPERVARAVCESRQGEKRSAVDMAVVQLAVTCTIDAIRTLPAGRTFDDVSRATKILAVLACPAPDRHLAVTQCCLLSLGNDILSAVVRQRLLSALPKAIRLIIGGLDEQLPPAA